MTTAHPRRRPTVLPPHDDSVTTVFRRIEAVSTSFGEALMPVGRTTTGARGLVVAGGLLGTAIVVVGMYVGLPLVLVSRDALHALPNALAVAAGVLLLVATGIATVLVKTTPKSKPDPQVVRRGTPVPQVRSTRSALIDGCAEEPATMLIPRVAAQHTASPVLHLVAEPLPVESPTMALPVVSTPTVVIPLQRGIARRSRHSLYVPTQRREPVVAANRH